MKEIKLQILQQSYWEHFKVAKDLALTLPVEHPKRKAIDAELNKMIDAINLLKSE